MTRTEGPHQEGNGPSIQVTPYHRTLVGVDIEGSTSRTNVQRAALRRLMYELVDEAMEAAGIDAQCCDEPLDRGDGILALVHPVDNAPKTVLLGTVLPTLSMLLRRHNIRKPELALRMRAVVHAGEIHYDGRGCFGEAVDLSCRLLDAPELKRRLVRTGAPLILVVSEDIFNAVVRHGYDGIDTESFEPLAHHVVLAGRKHRGWVTVPETGMIPVQSTDPGLASVS